MFKSGKRQDVLNYLWLDAHGKYHATSNFVGFVTSVFTVYFIFLTKKSWILLTEESKTNKYIFHISL